MKLFPVLVINFWRFIAQSLHFFHWFWMLFYALLLFFSCNTVFKEEEALRTANWTAWKFPIAHSWSGTVV